MSVWEERWHPLREEWVIVAAHRQNRPWIGETVGGNRPEVPHYLPGQNPWIGEFSAKHAMPEAGVRGGAETLLPEWRPGTTPAAPRPGANGGFRPEHQPSKLAPGEVKAVHVQGNVSDGQPFTSNRRLLEASVERLTFAGSAVAGETPDERIQAIRHSFQAIQDISERLGAVTGRRKAILWINGSVPFDPSEISGDAARQGSVAFMQRDAVRAATARLWPRFYDDGDW